MFPTCVDIGHAGDLRVQQLKPTLQAIIFRLEALRVFNDLIRSIPIQCLTSTRTNESASGHFRSAPINRHARSLSACLKRTTSGLMHRSKWHRHSIGDGEKRRRNHEAETSPRYSTGTARRLISLAISWRFLLSSCSMRTASLRTHSSSLYTNTLSSIWVSAFEIAGWRGMENILLAGSRRWDEAARSGRIGHRLIAHPFFAIGEPHPIFRNA